jgi:hypothetical protein
VDSFTKFFAGVSSSKFCAEFHLEVLCCSRVLFTPFFYFMYRSLLSRAARALAPALFLCIVPQIASSQTTDPWSLKPSERKNAGMPVPFGIVGTVGVGLSGMKSTDIDIDAYYSTLQAGFAVSDYGTVFTLATRSAGRDVWSGLGVQFGSKTAKRIPDYADAGLPSKDVSISSFGVLIKYGNNYGPGVSFLYSSELAVGVLSAKDESLIDQNDSDDDGSREGIYGKLMGSFGVRIPISNHGLTLGIRGGLQAAPPDEITTKIEPDDAIFGIAAYASFGFNLEK